MKSTIAFAALFSGFASLASAQNYFTVIAAHSGSPIHLQEINANGEGLWIGKDTAAYCPKVSGVKCPKPTDTAFGAGNGGLSMAVEVPGGQQVYINPKTGAVHYSIAHSEAPQGSILKGWTLTQGSSFGDLGWRHGIIFCPQGASGAGPYQMFAQVANVKFASTCLGADLLTSNQTKPGAFEYE